MQVNAGIPSDSTHCCWSSCFSDTGGKEKQFFPCVCSLRLQFLSYLLSSTLYVLAFFSFHLVSGRWSKEALSASGSCSGRSGHTDLRCLVTEAYASVRAWEREGNYCTTWVLCQYCNSTEKKRSFRLCSEEKVCVTEKEKCSSSFLRALLIENKSFFLKLISSMVAGSFLC